jgi:hypothetical protein
MANKRDNYAAARRAYRKPGYRELVRSLRDRGVERCRHCGMVVDHGNNVCPMAPLPVRPKGPPARLATEAVA